LTSRAPVTRCSMSARLPTGRSRVQRNRTRPASGCSPGPSGGAHEPDSDPALRDIYRHHRPRPRLESRRSGTALPAVAPRLKIRLQHRPGSLRRQHRQPGSMPARRFCTAVGWLTMANLARVCDTPREPESRRGRSTAQAQR
jgi:hypothetical protein